ncbi:MAG: GNAT family N-acetyltransferase [Bacteroidota bacterium]
MKKTLYFHTCESIEDYEIAKKLTTDYMEWLQMDLCFQSIDKEFETFSQMYGPPSGRFLYATIDGVVAGGVGVRKINDQVCEMKRLYVYEEFQGLGLGRRLCDELLKVAQDLGYARMRLDTVEKLQRAIHLYQKMGFYEIPKYYENPDKTVRFMELAL